jgi:hypothetical protein
MMEETNSSETSMITRVTRRHIPEDFILQTHIKLGTLTWRRHFHIFFIISVCYFLPSFLRYILLFYFSLLLSSKFPTLHTSFFISVCYFLPSFLRYILLFLFQFVTFFQVSYATHFFFYFSLLLSSKFPTLHTSLFISVCYFLPSFLRYILLFLFQFVTFFKFSTLHTSKLLTLDRSVRIANDYDLDVLVSILGRDKTIFSSAVSIPHNGPTLPYMQWLTMDIPLVVKWRRTWSSPLIFI